MMMRSQNSGTSTARLSAVLRGLKAGPSNGHGSISRHIREHSHTRSSQQSELSLFAAPSANRSSGRVVGMSAIFLILFLPLLQLVSPGQLETVSAAAVRALPGTRVAWVEDVTKTVECATRVALIDGAGESIGWLRQDQTCIATPSFRTARVTPEDAARFASFIEVVEGGHKIGRGTYLGINLLGLGRAIITSIQRLCCDGVIAGGSNGILTGLKNVNGEPGETRAVRRLSYLAETALLSAHLLRDDAVRDLWVTLTLPAARGADGSRFGPPIAGGLLPSVVFGKSTFSDLDDAELCILAAALHRQILIATDSTPPDARVRAAAANDRIRERAISRCVDEMQKQGIFSSSQADIARERIRTMTFPVSYPGSSDPDLILPQKLPGAAAFVAEAAVKDGLTETAVLRIALASETQIALSAGLPDLFVKLDAVLADNFCLVDCKRSWEDPVMPPDVFVAVTEILSDGPDQLVAIWQNRGGLFLGPPSDVPISRSSGSVTKFVAVPLFVGLTDSLFCRQSWAGLHDYGGYSGSNCSNPEELLDLAALVARSSNLAYAEAIDAVGTARLRQWFEALGISVGDRSSSMALRRSLATGENALASPRIMARAIAAISLGALGLSPVAEAATVFQGRIDPMALDLRTLGISLDDLAAARPIIAAPIKDERGTLRSLKTQLLSLGCDDTSLFGKSGSSDAADPEGTGIRDKLVFFHSACSGRNFVVAAVVGSPQVDKPLGKVTTALVGRLAVLALQSVLRNPEGNQ